MCPASLISHGRAPRAHPRPVTVSRVATVRPIAPSTTSDKAGIPARPLQRAPTDDQPTTAPREVAQRPHEQRPHEQRPHKQRLHHMQGHWSSKPPPRSSSASSAPPHPQLLRLERGRGVARGVQGPQQAAGAGARAELAPRSRRDPPHLKVYCSDDGRALVVGCERRAAAQVASSDGDDLALVGRVHRLGGHSRESQVVLLVHLC